MRATQMLKATYLIPPLAATAIVQESWRRENAISAARAFSAWASVPNGSQRAHGARDVREVSRPTRADAFESEGAGRRSCYEVDERGDFGRR